MPSTGRFKGGAIGRGGDSPATHAGAVAVLDKGTQVVSSAARLNFTGAGVTASTDGSGGVNIEIPGSSSGSSARRNTFAISRLLGAQSAVTAGSGLSGGVSVNSGWMGKWEAEAPFKRVRLWLFSREIMSCSRGWQFMVAPTETAAMDTVNNSFRPIVGGAAHNSYASIGRPWPVKGNDRYGWRKGTWGGAAKSGILYPGATASPSFGYHTISKPIASDWIDCPSVSRADGGSRPLMVFGITKDAFGTDSFGNYSASNKGPNDISLMSEEYKAYTEGKPWARLQLCSATATADYNVVNDLTKAPSLVNWLTAGAGGMPYLAWEFDFDVPARNLWAVGDSQTEAKHGAASGNATNPEYLLWWQMAANTKSTPSAPIQSLNLGMATNRTSTFRDQLFALLQTGARPTDLLYPNYSVNNSAPINNFTFEDLYQQMNELLEVIEVCQRLGIKLYLWTNPNIDPNGTNASGWEGNSAMAMLHAWTRQICAAGAATLVDIEANFNRSTMYIDGTHFNNLGDNYAASVLSAVL